jgi:hypothetical protein
LNAFAARSWQFHPKQKIKYLICLDNSKRVEYFWKKFQRLMLSHQSRDQVVSAMSLMIINKSEKFYDSDSQAYADNAITFLADEIEAGISWLSNDQSFNVIKKIFDKNRFIYKNLDICDETSMREIVKVLEKNQIVFDLVYFSNIREYAEDEKRLPKYAKGLKALQSVMNEDTIFIDTYPRNGGTQELEILQQRIAQLDLNIHASATKSTRAFAYFSTLSS